MTAPPADTLTLLATLGLICPCAPSRARVTIWNDASDMTFDHAIDEGSQDIGFVLEFDARTMESADHVQRIANTLGSYVSPASIVDALYRLDLEMAVEAPFVKGCNELAFPMMPILHGTRNIGSTPSTYETLHTAPSIWLEYVLNPVLIVGMRKMARPSEGAYTAVANYMIFVVYTQPQRSVADDIYKELSDWKVATSTCRTKAWDMSKELEFTYYHVKNNTEVGSCNEPDYLHHPARLGTVDAWYEALHGASVPCSCHLPDTPGYTLNWFIDRMRPWLPIDKIVTIMHERGDEWM